MRTFDFGFALAWQLVGSRPSSQGHAVGFRQYPGEAQIETRRFGGAEHSSAQSESMSPPNATSQTGFALNF